MSKPLSEVYTEVITNTSRLEEVLARLKLDRVVAVDTETDGLSRFRKVIGISFASNGDEGYYVPTLVWNGEKLVSPWQDSTKVDALLTDFFSSDIKLIGHNIQFDTIAIKNYLGIDLIDKVISDTKLLHHTAIDEEGPHSLKPLSVKYISPDADQSQKDLEEDVKSKGGRWLKYQKDFYMGDPTILGRYACFDVILTYRLHELFYPEIEKQNLHKLWFEEVLPLNRVLEELNSTGVRINVDYFSKLKEEVKATVVNIENQIYASYEQQLKDYEVAKVLDEVKITPRSALGKSLMTAFCADSTDEIDLKNPDAIAHILTWYKEKNGIDKIFNIDSNDDKAFLLFNIIGLQSLKTTKGGKQAVDKKTLDALFELHQDQEVVKLINTRSKEKKLLTTYIEPLLENHIDGRVYPQFNQTGTTSGRFTSSEPINFQTLPRDDLRIKKGFIPDEGYVFVNADFSSLEPRAFVAMSGESSLKKVYQEDLDLYSKVYIDMWNAEDEYSAKEEDSNYLKKKNPNLRNLVKPFVLGAVYGLKEYKLSNMLNVSVEEAKDILAKYFKAYPNLKKYMDKCEAEIFVKGEVQSLMGRKRRARLIPILKQKFPFLKLTDTRKISDLYYEITSDEDVSDYLATLKPIDKPKNGKDLSYMVKNEFNNAKNFKIQSLAASITNAASNLFYDQVRLNKLSASMILSVHDEITVLCKKEDSDKVAYLLRECMEHNLATKLIDVPMKAVPIIATNLAEAK